MDIKNEVLLYFISLLIYREATRGRVKSPERNREGKPFANEQDNLCQHVSTPYGTS